MMRLLGDLGLRSLTTVDDCEDGRATRDLLTFTLCYLTTPQCVVPCNVHSFVGLCSISAIR